MVRWGIGLPARDETIYASSVRGVYLPVLGGRVQHKFGPPQLKKPECNTKFPPLLPPDYSVFDIRKPQIQDWGRSLLHISPLQQMGVLPCAFCGAVREWVMS